MIRAAAVVFAKELADALRDRRTLLTVLLSAVAVGPLVLVLISTLVGSLERRAEDRRVLVQGIEHAPTLANFIARQTYRVETPPADWEQRLRRGRLADAVIVVAPGFEAALQGGGAPAVEVVRSSAQVRGGAGPALALLRGFNQEQATLRLAWRGVAPALLEAVRIEERDLADAAARGAQFTRLVPFFVLMAVLYGALAAALDTTAGERERGSLEPLLANPVPRLALVLGKWGAVVAVAMLVALLSCLSFLPGQWLLRSETLAAMFRFGPGEAAAFVALLLPLAAALAAVLMALAIRSRSFKEAQASATVVVLLASLLPLVTLFGSQGDAPWHLWVPALGQVVLMGRVLEGLPMTPADVAAAAAANLALAAAAIAAVVRSIGRAAVA